MAIVVGIDSSQDALSALRWAVAECRLRGTTLRAVHAWEVPLLPASQDPYLAGPSYDISPIDPAELRRLGSARLAETVSQVESDGVEIEQLVVEGHPAEVLIGSAEDAELLVVGSRGLGGLSRLVLGSVSQACAHHAHCPVVIVRAGFGDG